MESNADKLRSLRISSLDEEDDEPELPHRPPSAAADYEDDDDEDEEEAEVTLGFLEKTKRPGLLLRHLFPSKAGGIPIGVVGSRELAVGELQLLWLLRRAPAVRPPDLCTNRGQCGSVSPHPVHVHVPVDSVLAPGPTRTVEAQTSVKVFRCQLTRSNAFYSSEPPKRNDSDKPLCAGAPVCHWRGTWKGDKICGSCKKSRYCSEKHQALHWCSGHKNDCL